MTYDEFMLKSDAERRIIFDQMRGRVVDWRNEESVVDANDTRPIVIDPQKVSDDYKRRRKLNESREDADW